MQKIIDAIHAAGFKAYMRSPDATWAVFTDDDKRLGYIQWDRRGYATISTMHRPNKVTGTGFVLDSIHDLSRASLSKAFVGAPDWALNCQRESVKKWASWDEFKASSPFNASYELVTPTGMGA